MQEVVGAPTRAQFQHQYQQHQQQIPQHFFGGAIEQSNSQGPYRCCHLPAAKQQQRQPILEQQPDHLRGKTDRRQLAVRQRTDGEYLPSTTTTTTTTTTTDQPDYYFNEYDEQEQQHQAESSGDIYEPAIGGQANHQHQSPRLQHREVAGQRRPRHQHYLASSHHQQKSQVYLNQHHHHLSRHHRHHQQSSSQPPSPASSRMQVVDYHRPQMMVAANHYQQNQRTSQPQPPHAISSSPDTGSSYQHQHNQHPQHHPHPHPHPQSAILKLRLSTAVGNDMWPTEQQQQHQHLDQEPADCSEQLSDCSCSGSFDCISQPPQICHPNQPASPLSSQTLPNYYRQRANSSHNHNQQHPPAQRIQTQHHQPIQHQTSFNGSHNQHRSALAGPHLSLPVALPPEALNKHRQSSVATLSTCSLSPPPPPPPPPPLPPPSQPAHPQPAPTTAPTVGAATTTGLLPLVARQTTYTAAPDTITDTSLDARFVGGAKNQSDSQATISDSFNQTNNRHHPAAAPATGTPSRSVRIDEQPNPTHLQPQPQRIVSTSSSIREKHHGGSKQRQSVSFKPRNPFEDEQQQQQQQVNGSSASRTGVGSTESGGSNHQERHSNQRHRQQQQQQQQLGSDATEQQRFNLGKDSKKNGQANKASSLVPNNNNTVLGNNNNNNNNNSKNFIRPPNGGYTQSGHNRHQQQQQPYHHHYHHQHQQQQHHPVAASGGATALANTNVNNNNNNTNPSAFPSSQSPLVAGSQMGATLPAVRHAGHLAAATGSPYLAGDCSVAPASALGGSPLPPMPPLAITSHRTNSPWMRVSSIILAPVGLVIVLFIVVSPLLHYLM